VSEPVVLPGAAQMYLSHVSAALADLSDTDRVELLAEVHEHLTETALAADYADDYAVLVERLGDPRRYAAELRAGADLPPAPEGDETAGSADGPSIRDWLTAKAAMPPIRELRRYLLDLRPAWWALRGYLLVALLLAVLTQGSGYRLHTFGSYAEALDPRGNSGRSPAWVLAVVAAVVASIALGRTTPRFPPAARLAVVVLDAAAVFTFFAYPTWWLAPAFRSFAGL
jgi:HAAS domain-containing protein